MPVSTGVKTIAITNIQISVAMLFMGAAGVAAAAVGVPTNACTNAPAALQITAGNFAVCQDQELVHTLGLGQETYTVRGYSEKSLGLFTSANPATFYVKKSETGSIIWEDGTKIKVTYIGKHRNGQAIVNIVENFSTVKINSQSIVEEPNCTDTDGGVEYDVSGAVTYLATDLAGNTTTKQRTDYCYVGDQTEYEKEFGIGVTENLCSPGDSAVVTHKVCSNGCQNGACVPYFTGAPQLALTSENITATSVFSPNTTLYELVVTAPNTNSVSLYRVTFELDGSSGLENWLSCKNKVTDSLWKLYDSTKQQVVPATAIFTDSNGGLCSDSSILTAKYVTFVLNSPFIISESTYSSLILQADTTNLVAMNSGSLAIHVPADHTLPKNSPYYLKSFLWWSGEQVLVTDNLLSGSYLGLPLPAYTINF